MFPEMVNRGLFHEDHVLDPKAERVQAVRMGMAQLDLQNTRHEFVPTIFKRTTACYLFGVTLR